MNFIIFPILYFGDLQAINCLYLDNKDEEDLNNFSVQQDFVQKFNYFFIKIHCFIIINHLSFLLFINYFTIFS